MNVNKLYLLFLCLVSFQGKIMAQEPLLAKVFYKFSHVKDTANPKYPYNENMVLLLGKNTSEYKSFDKMYYDSLLMEQIKTGKITGPGKKTSNSEFFLYFSSKSAMESEAILKQYLFPIEYPNFHWKILPDKMSLAGLTCQKAIGNWKGRTYEAWFCPSLPFNTGPWKLCGLPGLILKARDLKNQVIFEFGGFQKYTGTLVVELPAKAIKVTKSEYDKLNEAFLDNPTAFIKSSMPQIADIKISTPYVRKPPINNPIELEK